MTDAFMLGPFLVPTLKVSIIGSLLLAIWLAKRIVAYTGRDRHWAGRVAETSVWLGLLGARLGFVVIHWSAYQVEPWTALYVWQPGYLPGTGVLVGAAYALWRIAQRSSSDRRVYAGAISGGFGAAALLVGGVAVGLQLLRDPALLYEGAEMPNLKAQTLDGVAVEFAGLRGQAVVLNVWASWCPPCRREMPLLDSISRDYAARGVSVVGLDLSEPPAVVRDYIKEIGVNYPIWVDRAVSATESS